MQLTCNNGRMLGPCQFAWGVTVITYVAVIALVLSRVNGADRSTSSTHPAPTKESLHAQP